MSAEETHFDAWTDARLAAALLAVDPDGLGGASVRSLAGPARDALLAHLRTLLPAASPWLRMPLHVTPDRLLGGLDLTATMAAGRAMVEAGLLARADGGVVIAAMAERLDRTNAALLCAALDQGEIVMEREGSGRRFPARIAVVALDEGLEPDERPCDALLDRLAFHLDLSGVRRVDPVPFDVDAAMVVRARKLLPRVAASTAAEETLCATAVALGIDSLRAVLFALRAARAAAALAGEETVTETDVSLAARLVFSARATQLPTEEPPEEEPEQDSGETPDESEESRQDDDGIPPDVVLEAARAAIPEGLLEALQRGDQPRSGRRVAGRSGPQVTAGRRGRPVGTRAGEPSPTQPLNVPATLRAAAPWQRLRGAQPGTEGGSVAVRRSDLRVTRIRQRTESVTIFVVDASGSAAMQRLAEAKGAVELLLADCYVRRDQVALIAFRGSDAELLLPPTRSLVRAKRSLAGLPGGGGTPLARAVDQAAALADQVRRRGQSPLLMFLTDGRANIGRDGSPGRAAAKEQAVLAAREVRASGLPAIVVDTSARPSQAARALADAMDARYQPLPYADADALSRIVRDRPEAA